MTALLEVKGIAKYFHGLRALNQVSFDAERGAIVALIGPNGAGKTTLFNVIAGMMAHDAGEIYFAGQRIDPGVHARIGRGDHGGSGYRDPAAARRLARHPTWTTPRR